MSDVQGNNLKSFNLPKISQSWTTSDGRSFPSRAEAQAEENVLWLAKQLRDCPTIYMSEFQAVQLARCLLKKMDFSIRPEEPESLSPEQAELEFQKIAPSLEPVSSQLDMENLY